MKMRKNLAFLLIALMHLQLAGCGKNDAEQAESMYLSEAVTFPDYIQVYTETTAGNTLYYCAVTNLEEEAIYRMNMEAEQPLPEMIPYVRKEQEHIQAMSVDADGGLHIITGLYEGLNADTVLKDLFWKKVDAGGQVLAEYKITDYFREQENINVSGFVIDSAGNACISMNSYVYVLDKTGDRLFETTGGNYISRMCRSKEGKVYIIQYGDSGLEMYEVDVKARGLGSRYDLSQLGSSVNAATGTEGDLLLASESTVFEYDIKKKSFTQKFEWLDVDVVADWYGDMLTLEDGRILWMGKEYQDRSMKTDLTMIRKIKKEKQRQSSKTVLTLGGVSMFIESPVRKAVTNFNKTNPDYRIEIKEYGTEDVIAGLDQLNADIISSNCPDILVLPLMCSLELYARKGVLTDLYPYIDADTNCKRSDFQENIVTAYETEGKLYAIPISYDIYTLLGKSSLLGDRNTWTLEEMIAFADNCPKDSGIFRDDSKSGALSICLKANGDQLVNWKSDENTFNRELFIKMLQFANRFVADDKYTYNDSLSERIQEGQMQLLDTNISSVSSPQLECALFGEQVTYVGYPSEKGSGSLVSSSSTMAISAKGDYKDVSWKFISNMLSEKFQDQAAFNSFPIRKSSLEKRIEQVMEVIYYTDADGNKKEQSKGFAYMGDFEVEIYAVKDQEVQTIRKLIESVDTLWTSDRQINSIITEEAQAFFGGSKSAEEVADIVENRIRTYVNEMK